MNVLQAPRGAHSSHTSADDADAEHDAAHPHVRAELGHGEVGRDLEDHIADVEQGQAGGDLVRREVQDGGEVVAGGGVHGLGEADVGADGRAEEVEGPEGGDDAPVEFPGFKLD